MSPLVKVVGTLESRIRRTHLYLSPQIGVRSSKTSQCGSANRPSVVPQRSPRIWCLSKSLLVSYQLCQCDKVFMLEPGLLMCIRGGTGEFSAGEISRPQTATVVVVKQSLGSWSHLWSLSNVSGCGSTFLLRFSCRDSPDKGSVSRFER